MCKITAIDVGMCLPKCFVIVVNLFTFLLGSIIMGGCIFGMITMKSMLEDRSLNFLFYGPIAFGGIIVFISFFGCCGACFKSRCMLMTFAILLLIIFACQVGFVHFVYGLFAQIKKSAEDFLMNTMKSSKNNEIYFSIWELIQQFFECCGVNSLNDWQVVNETLPMSCCLKRNETEVTVEYTQNVTCTQADAFDKGCKKLVTDYLDVIFNPITACVTFVLAIQLINVILSCCMFFVYGRTKRNEKQMKTHGFVDTSPARIHDVFIVKKDSF